MVGLNMTHNQVNIFSTPIVIENNIHEIDDLELSYLKSLPLRNSQYNSLSKDSFILNADILSKIANKIDGHVQNYIDNILEIDNQITRTQSWIAVNKKGQKHHAHEHPNTFVSAVYYPVCSSGEFVIQKSQSIIQEKYFFNFDIKNFNPANSKTYSIKVKSGDLVIFPGWLNHFCTENNDDNDRIALGVNYFLKGRFGSEDTVDLIRI